MHNYHRYNELYQYHKSTVDAKLPNESAADKNKLDSIANLTAKLET